MITFYMNVILFNYICVYIYIKFQESNNNLKTLLKGKLEQLSGVRWGR